MSDINYNIQPVSEKPLRRNPSNKTGSKYQPIIDEFLESGHELVRVDGTGKEAINLYVSLNKLIKKRGDSVKVSIRNNEVYLEKR